MCLLMSANDEGKLLCMCALPQAIDTAAQVLSPVHLGMHPAHAFVVMIADDHVSHIGRIIDPVAQAIGSTTLT